MDMRGRGTIRLLLALVCLAGVFSLPAPAADPEGLSFELREPHGSPIQVQIQPLDGGKSVRVVYSREVGGTPKKVEKIYGREVLEELRKTWGEKSFDLSRFRSELGCDGYETFQASCGQVTRQICHDVSALSRFEELLSAVQTMLTVSGK